MFLLPAKKVISLLSLSLNLKITQGASGFAHATVVPV